MADPRLLSSLGIAGSGWGTQAPQFSAPWGKSAPDGSWHSVIGHSLDVAVVAHRLMGQPVLHARLSAAFGCPLAEAQLDRLAVLTGIHDGGKCLAGFQAKLTHRLTIGQGHVAEFLAALEASQLVRDAVGIERLAKWFHDPEAALMAAICHHGEPASFQRIGQHRGEVSSQIAATIYGHDPVAEIRRLAEASLTAFPRACDKAPSLGFPPLAQHLLAGIVMTADWMASDPARFPYLNGGEQLRVDLADRVLQATGWSDWSNGASAAALLGGRMPQPAQSAIQEISPEERLVVIEAPTGNRQDRGRADSRRSAGRSWSGRWLVFRRALAVGRHGTARADRSHHGSHTSPRLRGRSCGPFPAFSIPTRRRTSMTRRTGAGPCRRPRRSSPRQSRSAPSDQAMLSILRVRHSWLRAACLSRQLLVIDEVHASDPYMAEIVGTLVDRHLGLGGHVLAMSATLGETALARLQRRERRPIDEAVGIPYPAIRTGSVLPVGVSAARRVKITLFELEECLAAAITAARAGQCTLLIRSTVADAIETWRRLSEAGVETMLHHSRYALHDRNILDRRLMGVLGPGGNRRGLVAVTTQTAEQSLDLDADLLITDACPADVLLQRLGRLHRHREGTRPVALMIDPGHLAAYLAPDGSVRGRQQQGWAWVYDNLLSVGQAIDWIARNGSITVPRRQSRTRLSCSTARRLPGAARLNASAARGCGFGNGCIPTNRGRSSWRRRVSSTGTGTMPTR